MDLASARAEIRHPPILHIKQLVAQFAILVSVAGLFVILLS